MKLLSILITTCLLLLAGCTPEHVISLQNSPVIVKGNLCTSFQSSPSRSATSKELPEDSRISFYSSGGLSVTEAILTYSGHKWQGDLPEQWEENEEPAQIQAYYPPLLRQHQSLYNAQGELQDILFCQQNIPNKTAIQLLFSHLFSRISFTVSPQLNKSIKHIKFTPSVRITSVQPETAEITYATQPAPTICFEKREEGVYPLILPPHHTLSIDISIVTEEEEICAQLSDHSFERGYSYDCLIKQAEGNIGIYTPEDFIAFTHLINGNEYEGRSLEEFGTTTGGITTYYLKNDLSFTEEQCSRLLDIGWIKSSTSHRGFNNIFDGEHHTLSQLIISTYSNRLRSGLFGLIDTEGVVKNLCLSQSSYSDEGQSSSMIGLLCGENRGTIDQCKVINSTLNTLKSKTRGGIAGINKGLITNCSVQECSFSLKESSNGGIAGINLQGILNCVSEKCSYKKVSSGGDICYEQREGGYMENCFSHGNTHDTKEYGSLIYKGLGGLVSHCYYPKNTKSIDTKGTVIIQESFSYNPQDYITDNQSIPLPILLNQWIDEEGQAKYPDLQFCRWQKGENGFIVHVKP